MMRWAILVALLVSFLASAGCGDGVALTRRERAQQHRRIYEMDMKQLNDDWDSFWLMDRPSRLSWTRVE